MLGLNASPLKKVSKSTCPLNRSLSRYSFCRETNRAAPPTGSRELSISKAKQIKYLDSMWYTSLKWRIRRSGGDIDGFILPMSKGGSRTRNRRDQQFTIEFRSHGNLPN